MLYGIDYSSARTSPNSESQRQAPPNIVLVVSDDQGYADLGFLGTHILTPNLDRLAAEGVRLTNFYVSWPACTPSRASLLTGRYPQRNGTYEMIRNDMVDYGHHYDSDEYQRSPERILGTDPREVIISQILKDSGYATGIFGKWDMGQLKRYLPLQRGFDYFYGFTNTGIDYWSHERYGVPSMWRANHPTAVDRGSYATTLFQKEALLFLKKHSKEPFFLYLPFNAPHGASNLDPEIRGRAQAPDKFMRLYSELENKLETRRVSYLAAVTAMDEAIGEILGFLDKEELTQNTLFIFMSDNGGGRAANNSPLRGNKSQLFEGGVRVPLIARWPNVIPPNTVSDEFLTSLEVFPTLVNAAGARLPQNLVLDGFDMLPVLQGKAKSQRTAMFWERRGDQAARVGHYKWLESSRGNGLFDLSKDIAEEHDLTTEQPQLLSVLKARFLAWKSEMKMAEPRGPFRDY